MIKNLPASILSIGILLTLIVSPLVAFAADYPSPKAEMQETIDRLVKVVEQYSGEKQIDVRRKNMREIIEPKFDFDEMAKRSLGAKWKTITPEQRKEFVNLFSELLAKTYLARIENVEKGMVTIKEEKIKFPKALVKTTVDYKGDLFPIDYKLVSKSGDTWRVYDVVIENIGLVANYRNEFAGIIRKEQFSGLLERLKEKNSSS